MYVFDTQYTYLICVLFKDHKKNQNSFYFEPNTYTLNDLLLYKKKYRVLDQPHRQFAMKIQIAYFTSVH